MKSITQRFEQQIRMAVWSCDGKMYVPLYGYDDEIVAYGTPADAQEQTRMDYLEIFNDTTNR